MLIERLREAGIRDLTVLQAFDQVPRHMFVPELFESRAYADEALPLGHGQTISRPSTHALYLKALELRGDERLLEVGERIWNLEREFNLAAGLTGADDTLPKRLLKEAAKTGPAEGKVAELDKMLPEYYELRGWAPDGTVTTQIRERLGLPSRA